MLKTIYGTAAADSGKYLIDRLRSWTASGRKSYVLVPEQFSVFTERRVINELGASARTRVEVLTFSRLASEVLSELGPLRLNYVDGAAREITAARALQLIEKKLDYFRPNTHQSGFSSLMTGLVSEFRRYGHSAEDIEAAAEKVGEDELSRKLRDAALFYRAYSELINSVGADAEENLPIILPKLKDFFIEPDSLLIITEFRSFTPLELDILTELMKKTAETLLILECNNPGDPEDIFASAALTSAKLCRAAETAGIGTGGFEEITERREMQEDIAYLCENYFHLRAEKYGSAEHIHLLRPESPMEEIETAAAVIHMLCRTRGWRQSDILILARDSETYSGLMPLIFEDCGINVFMDRRRGLRENPYLVCLGSILELLAYGFSYDRTMRLARSGFIRGLSRDDCDRFENYLLAADPSHAAWNSAADWSFNPDRKRFDMEQINASKRLIIDPVLRLKRSLKGRKTADEITGALLDFMERNGHEEAMRARCAEFSERGMIYLAEEYRMAWNGAVSVLSSIGRIMDGVSMTYEKYNDLFSAACMGIRVGVSPQTADSVVFSSADMFRSTGVKAVIVLGVSDGVFPAPHGAEGIISDSEREQLRGIGVELAMTAAEKAVDENCLIYSVLSAASQELYLMSPLTSGGSEVQPSEIITVIKGLFDIEYEDVSRLLPETRAFAMRRLKTALAAVNGEEASLSDTDAAIYEYFGRPGEFSSRLRSAAKADVPLSRRAVTALYGRDVMLSASRLEKYNSCAFSYFMSYGLLLRPRAVAELNPLEMGNILHKAMEKYFSAERDYDSITREKCRREMRAVVAGIAGGADEVMYSSSAYYKYMVMRMSGIAAATAWETIKFFRASRFRPAGFEVKIGDGGIPPLRIETSYGTVSVEGFIDRVDSAEVDGHRYLSVVDYKSSRKMLDKELAEAGVRFQPLIYMDALCSGGDAEPAAMLYQQMNDPLVNADKAKTEESYEKEVRRGISTDGWVVSDDEAAAAFDKNYNTKNCFISPRHFMPMHEMRARIENAGKKIAESAEGILSGEISVRPYISKKYDPCQYCDYRGVCGIEKN